MKHAPKITQLCFIFVLVTTVSHFCSAAPYMDDNDRYSSVENDMLDIDNDDYERLIPEEDDWSDTYDSQDGDNLPDD